VSAAIDRSGCPARNDRKGRPRHGDATAAKKYGCRCPDALRARKLEEYQAARGTYQSRLVGSTATARLLQAFAVAGYSAPSLSPLLELGPRRIQDMRAQRNPRVLVSTATRVRLLHADLHALSREGVDGDRTRAMARRAGWVEAARWERLNDPHSRLRLTDAQVAELRAAHAMMAAATWRPRSPGVLTVLADRFGITRQAVHLVVTDQRRAVA
jgi:hypothetical protein